MTLWPMFWGFGIDYIEVWPPKYYLLVLVLAIIQMSVPRLIVPSLKAGAFINAPKK